MNGKAPMDSGQIPALEALSEALSSKRPVASAVVCRTSGSAPRGVGARMLLLAGGATVGSVGGGILEARILSELDSLLERGGARLAHFTLTANDAESMGMICGGSLDVLLERIDSNAAVCDVLRILLERLAQGVPSTLATLLPGPDPSSGCGEPRRTLLDEQGGQCAGASLPADVLACIRAHPAGVRAPALLQTPSGRLFLEPCLQAQQVVLCGAGHIARYVAQLAGQVGFRVVVLDDRAEFAARARFPEAQEVKVVDGYAGCFLEISLGPGSHVVILTRGHAHDAEVLAQALSAKAPSIGMIGSRRKRDAVYADMEARGFSRTEIERVRCPVGLSIGAQTPEEIAVSIVAELVSLRAQRHGR